MQGKEGLKEKVGWNLGEGRGKGEGRMECRGRKG